MVFRPGNRNGEERKALDRVLQSRAFAASPRLAQFLRYVSEAALEDRSDQINEYAVGLDIYERGKDFDPRLDSTVRVEARRLRKGLERYYESEGADDPLRIVIPRGGYAPKFERRGGPPSGRRLAAGVAVAAVTALVLGWSIRREPHPPQPFVDRTLLQITADDGISGWPDITADGNLIVYSSDRDGGPDLDLWLRYVDRDETIQLTNGPGDEVEARFSPDGSLVAYTSYPRSSIHTIPALGGAPRLVTDHGKFPRFSPDGKQLAISRGKVGWSNELALVDLDSGTEQVLGNQMDWLGTGILWLPDGRLLAGGMRGGFGDWWSVPLDGSEPVAAEAASGFRGLPPARPPPYAPQAWLDPERGVLFAAKQGDTSDIWMMPFSLPGGGASGKPERLTQGSALVHDVAASAAGRVVYSSFEQNVDLWRLPMDIESGRANGPVQRLTFKPSSENNPAASAAGGSFVFRRAASSKNPGRSQLLLWQPGDEQPRTLLQGRIANYSRLQMSLDGRTLTYSEPVSPKKTIVETAEEAAVRYPTGGAHQNTYRLDLEAETVSVLCQSCPPSRGVSPDGGHVLHLGEGGDSKRLVARRASSDETFTVVAHPEFTLMQPTFSPDGEWIMFGAFVSGDHRRNLYIARFRPGLQTPESEWIRIAPEATSAKNGHWGSFGNLIYYISDEGGVFAIRAMPLDPETKRPAGDSWVVYESGRSPSVRSFMIEGIATGAMAVTKDAIIFDAMEQRGNIWMLDPDE